MLRTALAAALVTAALLPAVAANADPIKERQGIMEANGKAAKKGGAMLKGDTPFDAATAAKVLADFAAGAKAFGKLFPAGTDKGGDTEAAPAIWAKPTEWKAALTKFETDTAAAVAMKPADAASFGKAFGMVTANCKSCHEAFRVKKG